MRTRGSQQQRPITHACPMRPCGHGGGMVHADKWVDQTGLAILMLIHHCRSGLVYWKPTTPGQRHKISLDFEALGVYTGPPVPSLSIAVPRTGGRDHTGRLRVRGRGGGEKQLVRTVDYDRGDLEGVVGVIQRVEHDPNRSGFLALVRYERGEKGLD